MQEERLISFPRQLHIWDRAIACVLCLWFCACGSNPVTATDADDASDAADTSDPGSDDVPAIRYEIPGVKDPQITIQGTFVASNQMLAQVDVTVEGGELVHTEPAKQAVIFTVKPGSATVKLAISAPGDITRHLEVRGNRDLGVVPLFRAQVDLGIDPDVAMLGHGKLLVATAGRGEGDQVPYGLRLLDPLAAGTYVVAATDDPVHPALQFVGPRPMRLAGLDAGQKYALLWHAPKQLKGIVPSCAVLDVATGKLVADAPLSDFLPPENTEGTALVVASSLQPGHFRFTVASQNQTQWPDIVVAEVGAGHATVLYQAKKLEALTFSTDGLWLAATDLADPTQPLTRVIQLATGKVTTYPNSFGQHKFAADGSLLTRALAPGGVDCFSGCALVRRFPTTGAPDVTVLPDGVTGFWPLRDGHVVVQGDGGFGNVFEIDATGQRVRDYAKGPNAMWSLVESVDDVFFSGPGSAWAIAEEGGARTDFSAKLQGINFPVFWEPRGVDGVRLSYHNVDPSPSPMWDPATRTIVEQPGDARADGLLRRESVIGSTSPNPGTHIANTNVIRDVAANLPGVKVSPLLWPPGASAGYHMPCLPYTVTGGVTGQPEGFCVAD